MQKLIKRTLSLLLIFAICFTSVNLNQTLSAYAEGEYTMTPEEEAVYQKFITSDYVTSPAPNEPATNNRIVLDKEFLTENDEATLFLVTPEGERITDNVTWYAMNTGSAAASNIVFSEGEEIPDTFVQLFDGGVIRSGEFSADSYYKLQYCPLFYCFYDDTLYHFQLSDYLKSQKELEAQSELNQKQQEVDAEIDKIIAELKINKMPREVDKVLAIHDYIAMNVEYTSGSLNGKGTNMLYQTLIDKYAICEGYAYTFYKIMNKLGIDCEILEGKVDPSSSQNWGSRHSWNAVKLDGEWYYLDVTWDSNEYRGDAGKPKDPVRPDLLHRWFLLSPERFLLSHNTPLPVYDSSYTMGNKYIDFVAKETKVYQNKQWYLEAIKLDEAKAAMAGKDAATVQVALLDSGVNFDHQEFAGIINKDLAWDAVNDTKLTGDNSLGHGTKVLGVLAAKGVEMEGVAKDHVEIIPVGISPSGEDFYEQLKAAIKGFEYIEKIEKEGKANNLRIISLSTAFPRQQIIIHAKEKGIREADVDAEIEKLRDVIDRLRNDYGVLTIASGGNITFYNVSPTDYVVPGDFESVVCVTGTNKSNDNIIGYCYNENKDISAPGIDIFSTMATGNSAYSAKDSAGEYLIGTSFSVPIVSGVAALMLSVNPKLAPDQVESIIKSTARDIITHSFTNTSNDKQYPTQNGSRGLIDAGACVTSALSTQGTFNKAPLRAPAGAREIYVSGKVNAAEMGDGTVTNPYKMFVSALNAANSGDTIIIKEGGFVNDDGNNDPLIINKNLTIKGEGSFPSLSVRKPGILLEADVTFENLTISLSNAYHPNIFANGHALTLKDTIYDTSARKVYLIAGGLKYSLGTHVGAASGANAQINIFGKTNFGKIYAGGLNESYTGSVSINIDSEVTRYDQNDRERFAIYGYGAMEPNTNLDDWFGNLNTPLDPPTPRKDAYPTSGAVNVNIYETVANAVYGTEKTSVTFTGTGSQMSAMLDEIGSLNIQSGYFAPTAGSTLVGTAPKITVSSGAKLNAGSLPLELNLGSFAGGGILILHMDQVLNISGSVTGKTTVAVGDYGYGGISGVATNNKTYIKASGSTDNSFVFASPAASQSGLKLKRESNGDWKTYIDSDSVSEEIIKASTFSIPNKSSSEPANILTMPFNITYTSQTTVEEIGYVELKVKLNDKSLIAEYSDEGYTYKSASGDGNYVLELFSSAIYINKSDYSNLEGGEYKVEVEIPGTNTASGNPIKATGTYTLNIQSGGQQDNPNTIETYERKNGDENFSNIVVFVDFKDTSGKHKSNHIDKSATFECFEKTGYANKIFQYFDGTDGNTEYKMGLKPYLKTISFNELKVGNIFPQYNSANKNFTTFTVNQNASYYIGKESLIITEVVDYLNTLNWNGVNVDRNGDGSVDNLSIVLAHEYTPVTSSGYTSKKANYEDPSKKIAGKSVASYNVLMEERISGNRSGVVIHEFMHTLGYPDLYRNGNSGSPVGPWDIMSQAIARVQYPLAYMRYYISNWIDEPKTYRETTRGITLKAPTTASSKSDNIAAVLKTPYSDQEFFVVEYRKKSVSSDEYDYFTANNTSGLIIYRVNTAAENLTNYKDDIDGVYVFRPNDTRMSAKRESATASTKYSSFGQGTTFGSAEANASTAENAITYSDGTNSGIVIKNIGTAGNIITFDVEFNNVFGDSYWKDSTNGINSNASDIEAMCHAPNGNNYYVIGTYTGDKYIYTYNGSVWTKGSKVGANGIYTYALEWFNNALYIAYSDATGKTIINSYNGFSVSEVYRDNEGIHANEIELKACGNYLYMAYTDGNNMYMSKISKSGEASSKKTISTGHECFAGHINMASDNSNIALAFTDKTGTKMFKTTAGSDTWSSMTAPVGTITEPIIEYDNGALYMFAAVNAAGQSSTLSSYCYQYSGSTWNKVGTNAVSDKNIVSADLCISDGKMYITYSDSNAVYALQLEENQWKTKGKNVNASLASVLLMYTDASKAYVTGLNTTNNNYFVREYLLEKTTPPPVHTHSYSTTWSGNATHHWKECINSGCSNPKATTAYGTHVRETRNAKAATTAAQGYTGDIYCKTCNKLLESGRMIPKIDPPNPPQPNPQPPAPAPNYLYRYSRPDGGDWLITCNKEEIDVLKAAGWNNDGRVGNISSWGQGVPVYRFSNSITNDRMFSDNDEEIKNYNAAKSYGWVNEGIAFYYNPKASIEVTRYATFEGLHIWSTDPAEQKNFDKAGWHREGQAFRVDWIN